MVENSNKNHEHLEENKNVPSKKKNYFPEYPDPSKLAILRTLSLRHTGSNPSIGGSQLILRVDEPKFLVHTFLDKAEPSSSRLAFRLDPCSTTLPRYGASGAGGRGSTLASISMVILASKNRWACWCKGGQGLSLNQGDRQPTPPDHVPPPEIAGVPYFSGL